MTDEVGSVPDADVEKLEEWFRSQLQYFPDIPIKQEPRNRQLRHDILRRLVAQFLTDDERAAYFGLPNGCRIREGAKIIAPENLKMGEHCWIGENAILDASGGLEIGSHTSIGLSVFVWTHSSHLANLMANNQPGSPRIQRAPTKIGSCCFIAGPSVILPGVEIGDHVVVRPLSVVKKSVPDRSLVDRDVVKENIFTDDRIARMAKAK